MCLWRDPGAKNWRPVKNGEQASGDTSSLSSVGLKELKKKEKKKKACVRVEAREGKKCPSGLATLSRSGWQIDGRQAEGQSVRILDRKK